MFLARITDNYKENIQKDLVAELYKEVYSYHSFPILLCSNFFQNLFADLLQEDSLIATRRKVCAEQLEALRKAKKVIQNAEISGLSSMANKGLI
jgi:hypothetical protein